MKRTLLPLLATTLATACSHPLEIIGSGDIVSASGERNCYLENFQAGAKNCKENLVVNAYAETYYSEPRPGWEFERWENYCTNTNANACSFNVAEASVRDMWGSKMPPLIARFKRQNCEPATTVGRYKSSSYSSCNAQNDDLTGLWILVSNYDVIVRERLQWTLKQRVAVTITRNQDNTLSAHMCNYDPEAHGEYEERNTFTFPANATTFTFFDEYADTNMQLNKVSNTRLEGMHVNDEDTAVLTSNIVGIKVRDAYHLSPGTINFNYTLGGESFASSGTPIECFVQWNGRIQLFDPYIGWTGENLVLVKEIDSPAGVQRASTNIFVSSSSTDREIDFWLFDSEKRLTGDDGENATATYLENNSTKTIMEARAIDDYTPGDGLNLRVDLTL